jgi:hypothetical protein
MDIVDLIDGRAAVTAVVLVSVAATGAAWAAV